MGSIDCTLRGVEHHPASADDVITAKRCADALNKHYPGHLWAVHVDSDGGMVYIRNLLVSSLYGYKLYLSRVNTDPDLRCVMRAGGEILERGKMAAGRARGDGEDLINSIPEMVDGIPEMARRW